jgi:hypothetical protein
VRGFADPSHAVAELLKSDDNQGPGFGERKWLEANPMIVYHRTYYAEAILRDGFRDASGTYLTSGTHKGVWFSDVPLDENEGADGDTVLAIDIPDDMLAPCEWIEEEKAHREFLCPAELVNRFGPPKIHEDDWQGQTEAKLLRLIAAMEEVGAVEKAERIREKIPFLKKHGLLAAPEAP